MLLWPKKRNKFYAQRSPIRLNLRSLTFRRWVNSHITHTSHTYKYYTSIHYFLRRQTLTLSSFACVLSWPQIDDIWKPKKKCNALQISFTYNLGNTLYGITFPVAHKPDDNLSLIPSHSLAVHMIVIDSIIPYYTIQYNISILLCCENWRSTHILNIVSFIS